MKLLPKKQIINQANNDRAVQIKEGVELAKKIDALRQSLGSLEEQHKVFLATSKVELENELGPLQRVKEDLDGQIRKLEERRKELLKPLDDEWEKLDEEKKQFKSNLEKLQDDIDQSRIKQEETEILHTEAKQLKEQNEEELKETKKIKQTTFTLKEKAQEYHDKKKAEYDSFKEDERERTKALDMREKELLAQANFNEHTKKTLETKEKKLNDKDRAIRFKYETLQRTITRLKKK